MGTKSEGREMALKSYLVKGLQSADTQESTESSPTNAKACFARWGNMLYSYFGMHFEDAQG